MANHNTFKGDVVATVGVAVSTLLEVNGNTLSHLHCRPTPFQAFSVKSRSPHACVFSAAEHGVCLCRLRSRQTQTASHQRIPWLPASLRPQASALRSTQYASAEALDSIAPLCFCFPIVGVA